ncbi:hypothetical protein FALCPG4_017078 [Fusarium falciforme]
MHIHLHTHLHSGMLWTALGSSVSADNLTSSRSRSGRFIAAASPGVDELGPQQELAANAAMSQNAVAQPRPDKSLHSPDISVDLASLCHASNRPGTGRGTADHDNSEVTDSSPGAPPLWGQSWYLSWVLQATNNEHLHLYRPLADNISPPRVVVVDGDGGLDDASSSASSRRACPSAPTMRNDLPPPALVEELVQEYFQTFHPFCPIVDRGQLLESMANGTVSQVLLHAMLFVASIHCEVRILHRLGYNSRIEAEDDLFTKARIAFDSDEETDRISALLSSYLLHYWSGSPNKSRDSLWWMAGTVRLAQCMGMHRTTRHTQIPCAMGRMWRRIWWLLYIRDRQLSMSLGKPMIINDQDCDTKPLTAQDMPDESPETIAYAVAQAQLSVVVSSIQRACLVPANRFCSSDYPQVLLNIGSMMEEWYRGVPPMLRDARGSRTQLGILLSMVYHFYRIILYQSAQRLVSYPPTDQLQVSNRVIMEAAEAMTVLTEASVTHSEARFFPMICLSAIFASMTAQYTQSRSASLTDAQRQSLQQSVKYKLLALKEFQDCHVMSKWIRQLFRDAFEQEQQQEQQSKNPTAPTSPSPSAQAAVHATESARMATPQAFPGPPVQASTGLGSQSASWGAARSTATSNEADGFTLPTSQAGIMSWDGWTLTQDLGYPAPALVDNADFDAVGPLPFPWSDYSSTYTSG